MPDTFVPGVRQPNLDLPLLNAMLNNADLVSQLPTYLESVCIFTRKPPPVGAPYPMLFISPDIAKQNLDGISDLRPKITVDLDVYGRNDSSEHYRAVEDIAYLLFDMFHHERFAVVPPDGWALVDIEAHGPTDAPTDDDMFVGRKVTLNVLLAQTA